MIERDKDVYAQFQRMVSEIHKEIIGVEDVIENTLIAIFSDGHILLESVPGMGKTMLARAVADTLDCSFKRVQCTPDLSTKDLLGEVVFDEEKKKYTLHKGPIFTNLLLVDEINRAPPITQSALLECMAEKQVTLSGQSYPMPQPFTIIATQNPVEQAGTYVLPEAQKDRFMVKVSVKYPRPEDEISIVKSKLKVEQIQKVFSPAEVLIIRDEIKNNVSMSDTLLDYVVRIIDATRERREVATGASPRASIAFMRAGKTRAFLYGRDHVTAEDIQLLAYPILRHRLILNPNVAEYGTTADDIIEKILKNIEAP
jgi:MoxR-like ATPase